LKKLLTFAERFNWKPPQQATDKNIKKFFNLKLAKQKVSRTFALPTKTGRCKQQKGFIIQPAMLPQLEATNVL